MPPITHFRDFLGVNITHRGKDKVVGELKVRPELCRPGDTLHGGAFMGLGDVVGGHTTLPHLPEGMTTTTIESKTNFLAPVAVGDTATAVGTAIHVGRTTVVVQTKITRGDGRLACIVTQTQLVMAMKKD